MALKYEPQVAGTLRSQHLNFYVSVERNQFLKTLDKRSAVHRCSLK